MAEIPSEKASLFANMYKAITENIIFLKRQQWAITNYTVLVYAALFALSRGLLSAPTICERLVLAALTLVAGAFSTYLLVKIQSDLGRHRTRLEKMHDEWLTDDERRVMGIKPYVNPALRGGDFLIALIGVVVIGAGIVIYSLCRG